MPGFKNKFFLFSVFFLISSSPASSEIITLNSGKVFQAEIIEETSDSITADFGLGVPVTFYRDEVASIEETVEESLPPAPEPEPEPIENKSFLWHVKSDSGEVYLLGSIHLGKSDMYPLAEEIEAAFKRSDVLVVEVDTTKINPGVAQKAMLSRGMYPPGDSLEQNLPRRTLINLKKYLAARGMSVIKFNAFKPWFVAMTLTVLQIKELGFEEDYGVDLYFLNKASASGKKVLELESLEAQLDFLNNLPLQSQFLDYSLYSLEETAKMLDELLTSWKTGNAETMERLIITEILGPNPELRPIYEKILFERNRMMAERIEACLQDTGTVYFVTVGAGHLVGDEGIVELLKAKDYKIEQL